MKRMNSADIARLAGVSRSTVSRVINNYPNVPDETRQRVMKVIKENHYYPQLCGQMLNGTKSRTIGLFWVSRASIALDPLSSSYFMNIVDAATAHDYLVLSCILDNLTDARNVQFVRRVFMEGRIDAGIFIGANNSDPLLVELLEAGEIIGVFDYYQEQPVPNCITANFERCSGEKAVDYLYGLGHRRIAFIDGDLNRLSCLDRHESFIRGMLKHGLSIRSDWMVFGGITQTPGYQATRRLLENARGDLPTAIFATNDAVAFGVYQACRELGLSIPGDISVIGVDGHINDTHIDPPLTTIAFDFRRMFSSLVARIIDAIDQKEGVETVAFHDGTLCERASCCPPRSR